MPKKEPPLNLRYTISHPGMMDKLKKLAEANLTTPTKMFYNLAVDKLKELDADSIVKTHKP